MSNQDLIRKMHRDQNGPLRRFHDWLTEFRWKRFFAYFK